MDGWTKVKGGAPYGGVGERTFRDWFKNGLRCVRLPSGTILTKYEWIDEFLEQFENTGNKVDAIVDSVMKDF